MKKPAPFRAGFATCSPVTCLQPTQAWQPFLVTGSLLPLLEAIIFSFVEHYKPIRLFLWELVKNLCFLFQCKNQTPNNKISSCNIKDGKIAKTLQKTPANQNFYDLLVLGLHNKA
jgi:hypothetical protein